MKTLKVLPLLMMLITSFNMTAQLSSSMNFSQIQGTWIAEDDPKVKLVFNSEKCFDYYQNVLTDTFTYSFSNECGNESDPNSWFLKKTDQQDQSVRCYEVYGINDNGNNTLSLRDMITGKIYIYTKQ